ncbi:MAG: hypothetical protein V4547_19125 [Bacteroidota bacterium]
MKNLKKTIKLFGFVLLIILASVGVGIGGGTPVLPTSKKEDSIEIKVELPESKDNENEAIELNFKK